MVTTIGFEPITSEADIPTASLTLGIWMASLHSATLSLKLVPTSGFEPFVAVATDATFCLESRRSKGRSSKGLAPNLHA